VLSFVVDVFAELTKCLKFCIYVTAIIGNVVIIYLLLILLTTSRVVSPEISSGKFSEISGILFLFFLNFRKIAGTILQGTFYHYKPSK